MSKDEISEKVRPRDSAVDQAATELRILALSHENGDFIGSEDDLIAKLGVSRPTLRQASSRVVQEHLISIRRGVSGGYFARLPGSMSVSRMAALYLLSRDAGLSEITAAMKPLRAELAIRAAQNDDSELRAQLFPFANLQSDEDDPAANDGSYRKFLKSEREFGRILGAMSANSVLTLLLMILYDLAAQLNREQDVLISHPDRVRRYRELRAKLAQAIIDCDVEFAELSSHRCSDLVAEWMLNDFKGHSFADAVAEG